MFGMATWQDGPEYAPLERPQDFERPVVPDLDVAPETPQLAALAPKDRPGFADPSAPVAPLAALVPAVKDPRDPTQAFDVVSAAVTSDSAWGSAHWNPPSGPTASVSPGLPALPVSTTDPAAGPWGPPAGTPWPAPQQPLVPHQPAGAPAAGGFPAPGTPAWFGPNPYAPPPGPPAPLTFMQVVNAATPGLCIVLLIGGVILPLAPLMIGVALGLSSRVRTAAQPVRRVFVGAVSAVVFFAIIGMLTNETGFADWWRFVGAWSLAICWLTLAGVLGLVYRELKNHGPATPSNNWG
jgi:hypothetical protein